MTAKPDIDVDVAVADWHDGLKQEEAGRLRIRHAARKKADAVRRLRSTGLSLRQVADLVGVSPPVIAKYEKMTD